MKATKKIVGAACALVAAVALSAGSTFAWFAENTQVTADSLVVNVSAPTSLYISNDDSENEVDKKVFKSSVTCVNESGVDAGATFSPVVYSSTYEFYELSAAGLKAVLSDGSVDSSIQVYDRTDTSATIAGKTYGGVAAYTTTKEYFKETIWIKVEGASGMTVIPTLTQSVTVTGSDPETTSTENILKAMNVVFLIDGSYSNTYSFTDGSTTASEITLDANSYKKIEIYYFLSGNSEYCNNANITKNTTFKLSISFDKKASSS